MWEFCPSIQYPSVRLSVRHTLVSKLLYILYIYYQKLETHNWDLVQNISGPENAQYAKFCPSFSHFQEHFQKYEQGGFYSDYSSIVWQNFEKYGSLTTKKLV